MPTELPHEFDGHLDYDELIELLTAVEGEEVFVHLGWGRTEQRSAYTVAIVGTLQRVRLDKEKHPDFGDEEHFTVGSGESLPYGGSLILARSRVHGAQLRTMDGNDFFAFAIDTDAGSVSVVSEAIGP